MRPTTTAPAWTWTGNQNELITAVAAANPHTIVVLDTGSPVVLPWLNSVPSVLEAWYPGQTDGTAIASVLFGDSNPSGHLPQTWPTSLAQMPTSATTSWGNATSDVFNEGVDIGYRWYQANDVTPLFPFDYGLSYTSFAYRNEHVQATGGPDDSGTAARTTWTAAPVSGVTVDVAYSSLTQAFDNVGVSDDTSPSSGNFDGTGDSYSAQALAAVGITSRQTIDHDGAVFTWPDTSAGQPDNVRVAGQTIAVPGSGSELDFLLAGTHGVATGTGVITYTDGSTASFNLVSDNWTVQAAGGTAPVTGTDGNDVLATTAHWNPTTSPNGDYQVAVFGDQVPLDRTKTVSYLTLPTSMGGGDGSGQQTTHLFAVAIGN